MKGFEEVSSSLLTKSEFSSIIDKIDNIQADHLAKMLREMLMK